MRRKCCRPARSRHPKDAPMRPDGCRVAGTARRDCVKTLPNGQGPAGRASAVSRVGRDLRSGASAPGIRLEPDRAGLSVRPRQSCGESDEDRHDDNGHQPRVSRHHAPPGLFEGHYLRPMPGVIDRDQKSESAVESPSGRGQGLDARRVDQADTAVNDGDRSVAFKLGEGATDGLDGQAEIIGDVLAAHRKWNRVGRPLERE
ncbi:hypothetical protein ABIE89_008045 [Bradyrhizobium niftali]